MNQSVAQAAGPKGSTFEKMIPNVQNWTGNASATSNDSQKCLEI